MRHEISGQERTLVYTPREVSVDGAALELESVWAGELGDRYVEVVHLGDGPSGGELVLVDGGDVVIGDLYTPEPDHVSPDWASTIDLVLGLLTDDTRVVTSHGVVDRETIEVFHQTLLGRLHGQVRH